VSNRYRIISGEFALRLRDRILRLISARSESLLSSAEQEVSGLC
jgi:hypothetical protein